MGLVKRRLYRPDRKPARYKHWKPSPGVKLTEAGLSLYEAELGVAAIADSRDVRVGRILDYDPWRNVFTVVGNRIKDRNPSAKRGRRVILDPKPVEVTIAGWRVSQAVLSARIMAGVSELTRGAE